MSDFPVTISADAITQIRNLLNRKGEADTFLRIGVKGGGCSGLEYVFRLDTKAIEGDLIWTQDEITVRCDSKSAKFLAGAELIYTGNLIGGGFNFKNPNAARSCGCGTSFTPK